MSTYKTFLLDNFMYKTNDPLVYYRSSSSRTSMLFLLFVLLHRNFDWLHVLLIDMWIKGTTFTLREISHSSSKSLSLSLLAHSIHSLNTSLPMCIKDRIHRNSHNNKSGIFNWLQTYHRMSQNKLTKLMINPNSIKPLGMTPPNKLERIISNKLLRPMELHKTKDIFISSRSYLTK